MKMIKKAHKQYQIKTVDSDSQGYVVMGKNPYKLVNKMQFTRRNLMKNQNETKKLQNMVMQKFKQKVLIYRHFNQKAEQILQRSKKLIQSGDGKGLAVLQGLRLKFDKKNSYIKILESYNKQRRLKFWNQMNQTYKSKKKNILQIVKLVSVQTQSNKQHPIGLNNLINKNWISSSQNVKPIYDKINWFNKKFIQHIQGVFMSSNFIFSWQRTKMILRRAALRVSKDKQDTTSQNILNQLYQKISEQGQIDSSSERMKKIKQATKAYSQQIHQLSIKINQMHNTASKQDPNQKLLNDTEYQQLNKRLKFVRNNLQKVADRYQQLMVLTSNSTKGKFYINLMLLFLGSSKVKQIQSILNQIPEYNRATDGFGFQKLQKKSKRQSSDHRRSQTN